MRNNSCMQVAVVGAGIAGKVAARELHSEGTCACSRIDRATKIMSIFPFFPQENVSRPAHAGKKTTEPHVRRRIACILA
jgi:cation diffusion facilitator CzcD-associated flavoprotein CzcO